MRRGRVGGKLGLLAGSALVIVLVLVGAMSLHRRYTAPEPASPEVLRHIAERNRNAAVTVAAQQRANSMAASRDANAMVAQQAPPADRNEAK